MEEQPITRLLNMTAEQAIAADIERVVAILLGRDTNQAERETVAKAAPGRPDSEVIRSRLEHFLETGRAEPFQGYSNDFFPTEYARGERACAWRCLLRDFWDKNQAIAFALRQIENANSMASNPWDQRYLEEAQLEAIAELVRHYEGDCDVAASLANVVAFPYVLWRLHSEALNKFLGCSDIVPPLARRLSGEYTPQTPPPRGREEPAEFAISTADLFRAIAPHLAQYPELWDLLERSAVEKTGEFEYGHINSFVQAMRAHPRTTGLLRAMCARMPTGNRDEYRNRDILRTYLTLYRQHEADRDLLMRLATEGQSVLAQEAIIWFARFYQAEAETAGFLSERMRTAGERDVRHCAFHCLILFFGDKKQVAEHLLDHADREPLAETRELMKRALAGRATFRAYESFKDLEGNASGWEDELFTRQVRAIQKFRTQ